ncbi:MAG TPA: hypothetical protein VH518_14175 [Tepidisphaeraceae bacterium]|jgi:hypothetical protein
MSFWSKWAGMAARIVGNSFGSSGRALQRAVSEALEDRRYLYAYWDGDWTVGSTPGDNSLYWYGPEGTQIFWERASRVTVATPCP